MRLFLVRHAEAASGHPDDLRPLTPEGRDHARRVGERLSHERPEAVVTSPLLRARETGGLIAKACGIDAQTDEALAPGADAESLRAAVEGRGDTVVAVGHNPDCSDIVEALTGRTVRFPPGHVEELAL